MIQIRRLHWDEWNVAHLARHHVTPEEAEEVCHGSFILLHGKKGRAVIVGPTRRGRLLAVVLDPEPEEEDVYYPVTARPAARKERRLYQARKGGEET
jgi:hypothetical protein